MTKTVSEVEEDYYRGYDDGLAKGRHEQLKATGLYRVEALQVASRLVAGALEAGMPLYANGKKTDPVTATMNAADQLVGWLEKSDG